MSLTLTLTKTTSILTASYFPALDLNNDEYELSLTNFETTRYRMLLLRIINSTSISTKIITIPEGSYELSAINKYLRAAILHTQQRTLNDKDNNDDEYILDDDDDGDDSTHKEEILILRANENTMRSEIKCAYRINFTKSNNIGLLLGYSKSRVIQPNKWYASTNL